MSISSAAFNESRDIYMKRWGVEIFPGLTILFMASAESLRSSQENLAIMSVRRLVLEGLY
jgi:hypothetical protein